MPTGTGTRLVDRNQIVNAVYPANYSGAAGAPGTWVSLKSYNHVTIVITSGAWAAGTAAVTLNQATAVAGTSSKALAFTTVFTNTVAPTVDTLITTAVVSNTFTLGTANTTWVIEVDADTLDRNNDFDCLQVAIASPGSNADLYQVTYILGGAARYGSKPDNLPSSIVD